MYLGCSTAGNRRKTVSKTSSMLCLRKLIGEPLGPVRVLGEDLTDTPAPAPASCSRHSRRPWEASSPERHATGRSVPQEDHGCWSYSQPRWRSLQEHGCLSSPGPIAAW